MKRAIMESGQLVKGKGRLNVKTLVYQFLGFWNFLTENSP
jgi:hypothetical protein